MPLNWRINITPRAGGRAEFAFEDPPDVRVGDHIIWSNKDSVAHFPTPVHADESFMPNEIAPQSSSAAFAPTKAGLIAYYCSLHPEEKGDIVVGPVPEIAP